MPGSVHITDAKGNSTSKNNNSDEPSISTVIDGLSPDAIRVSATTYSSTKILGFMIIDTGTGDLTFTPNTTGATPVVVTAAELTAMGINAHKDWPIACSSITAGTGMEILAYIP